MYNDNRTTIPQDQDAMLHEYQMDRYPSYRKNYNSKKYEQDMLESHGLEPSMGDPMFALLGPSSKGFHALGGAATSRVGRGMDNMINVPMVEGRRNALKTAGVAGGATALGVQPVVQAVKMFGDDAVKAAPFKGQSLGHIQGRANTLDMMGQEKIRRLFSEKSTLNSGKSAEEVMDEVLSHPDITRIGELELKNMDRFDKALGNNMPTVSPSELKRFIKENSGYPMQRNNVANAQAQLDSIAKTGKIYRPSEQAKASFDKTSLNYYEDSLKLLERAKARGKAPNQDGALGDDMMILNKRMYDLANKRKDTMFDGIDVRQFEGI